MSPSPTGARTGARTGASTGRPPRTSRADVLAAATRLIDRDGWEQLTIRRLAAEIGSSPATIYNHVRDKDDLLVQVLNEHAARLPRPVLPDDPLERIIAVATVLHDELAARPWIVEIITADDLLGDSALWFVEAIVGGAVEAGADPEEAVRIYRHIWYYTVGEILIRTHRLRRREQLGRPTYREQAIARLDPETFPHLASVADRWTALTAEDTYAEGVRALIDGALH